MTIKRDGAFQRIDRPGWFVSYLDSAGIRRKKKVVASTRTQALNILAALKTQVQRETILGVREPSDISTKDLLTRFLRHQKPRIAPETYIRLQGIAQHLLAALPAQLRHITRAHVADYVSTRSAIASAATVGKEFTTLKHALRLALEWELLTANPADRVNPPKTPEGRTRFLTPPELQAAIAAAPEWLKAPITFAVFTGMRRGEMLTLCWKDVDLPNRRAYLRETKNESLHVVPLNAMATQILQDLPLPHKPGARVFGEINANNLSVATRRLFASLGMPDASFHTLRHTAASWMAMKEVPLYTIGNVLGHKTPRMTQRYAHLAPSYLTGAVAQLDDALAGVLPLKSGDAVGTRNPPSSTTLTHNQPRPTLQQVTTKKKVTPVIPIKPTTSTPTRKALSRR